MKTKYTIALFLLVAAAACSSIQEEPVNTDGTLGKSEEVFYATLEQGGQADATKVYADENLKVLWNADDRITIYNRYTYGYQYAFQGITGDSAGAFLKKEDDAEFVTGNPLEHIYAVYPYREDNKINNSGDLSITWPSPQTYKANSFGIGANVMVSVTDNNQLRFRNVGGYLALKLYGDNVSVTSITLRGNNGEKLSGRATVTCAPDANPTLSFQSESQGSLQLNCTSPVHIGSTAESATTFWLVVPPTHFTQGFNITVRTSDGLVFFKSTDLEYEIERNTLTRMAAVEVVPSDIVPFADDNFKAYCVANFDTDNDGEISLSEALAVNTIDVNTDNIYSLDGVEYFTNLRVLYARGSAAKYGNLGQTIFGDPTDLPDPAEGTSVASGKLSRVFLSGLIYLQYIDISKNNCIVDFTPGNCMSLRTISCVCCNITSLDVSNNAALTVLQCGNNQLTTLDVSNNTALDYLDCGNNQLATLVVSNNTALTSLHCGYNQLTALDVSHNTALTFLHCGYNQLTALDVSHNTALTFLDCGNNQLATLDVSNNTALTSLYCGNNQLTALDLSNSTALTVLHCYYNQLTTLDVSNKNALTELWCYHNQLTALDVSNSTAITVLYCYHNQLTTLDVSNKNALTELWCSTNQLTALNISDNIALTRLSCGSNQLPSLDVSNNTALTSLNCGGNQLTFLDVSNNTALTFLYCANNQLTSLDISYSTALTGLTCHNNQLAALDVTNNTVLTSLDCQGNQLTTLDVSYNTALTSLYCVYNQLTALDVSNNSALTDLWCFNNPYLTDIWLKTGQTIQNFSYDYTFAQLHYKD